MTTSILVTGGTGTLGRPVARRLRDAGASVTVLSRHPRETAEGIRYTAGDLSTGEAIEAAARGGEVIVHAAGSSKGDEQKTRTLVGAAKDARHIVLISVVGADRIPQASAIDRAFFGYFGMKRATERVIEQSGIGWTTLRATQFHDLILMVARALAKLPVIPAPAGFRFQPVDAAEVAERMAELALGEPSGLVRDLAGPKIYTIAELVSSYLRAAGKRRPLVPGAYSRPGRQGAASRGEPGPRSRRRQADLGGIPGRPDLDDTQNVQIRSSFRVDNRRVPVDQIESGYVRASSSGGGSGASWADRIAGSATAPPMPAAGTMGSGPSTEGPLDLS
jgi:uncharacterized protein YbjT (DUF2867 family)